MENQVRIIQDKLNKLRQLDINLDVFGAMSHQYKLNPALSNEQIKKFESTHTITLPEDFVLFLTEIGNGGAGPFYGLQPLQNMLFNDLDYKQPDSLLNPSQPFLHTQPWNLEFKPTVNEKEDKSLYEKQYKEFEDIYFDNKERNGVLAICNYGCGISLNLVVNGAEYGYLWTDDRANENGIYPSMELGNENKIQFLEWYELWLDQSIKDIKQAAQNKPKKSFLERLLRND